MYEFIKEKTAAGRRIMCQASRYEGTRLEQVYDHPSDTKRAIFDKCHEMFVNTEEGANFRICSFNSFIFTVSWEGKINGHWARFYITPSHNYCVLCG